PILMFFDSRLRSSNCRSTNSVKRHLNLLLGRLRQIALERDFVKVAQWNARLLEAKLDAAAEFSRDIVFAIQHGADLHPEDGAIERERFDSEDARAVDER